MFLAGSLFVFSCASPQPVEKDFFKGLSFVASPNELGPNAVDQLISTHADAVSLMPFGYMPAADIPVLRFDVKGQWWGESAEGCRKTIQMCKTKGMKVMLKPQIWIGRGTFTGYIEMKDEASWINWENNYRSFILLFAEIAQTEQVELFCIGTELAKSVTMRPLFWKELILEIRKIYMGKLTYAENWDSFDQPAFLKDLDFIGVDAYFPLSENQKPTKEDIEKGWKPHLDKMKQCAEKFNKPILFTEWGYRNIDYSANKPWDYSETNSVANESIQVMLYEVVFEKVFSQPYMAGGFLWKWHPEPYRGGRESDTQFSPQGKAAEKALVQLFRSF